MFKLGSQLVYGKDIRQSIPLMSIDHWARERMHAAYWLMNNVFERPKPVCSPLDFPDPDAPHYGYANRPMRLADGREILTTRNLIRITGWIATARLAHETQEYVVRKRECSPTYQRAIGDEWTSYLAQVDQRCRTDWHYRVPEPKAEQQELRAILAQTLAFENHFLAAYRQFLLSELANAQPGVQLTALQLLNQVLYANDEVIQAVRGLKSAQDEAVRAIATAVYSSAVG